MDPYQQYPSPAGMYSGQRPSTAGGSMSRQHFSSSTGNLKSTSMYRDPASAQKAPKGNGQAGAVAPPPPLIQPRSDSTNRPGPRSPSATSRETSKNPTYTPNSARGVSGQQQRMSQMGAYTQQKQGQYSAQQARGMYQNSPHQGVPARHPHASRLSTGGFSHSTNSLPQKADESSQLRAQDAARATGSRPQAASGQTGVNMQHRRQQQKKDPAPEDEAGHYQVVKGQTIDRSQPFPSGRYTIVKLLGTGTYGKVVQCEDHKYNRAGVAIKLVRREPPLYRVSAKNEITILRDLGGKHGTLKLLRDFEHMGHVCMTFELLGDHLSDVLQKMGRPFKIEHVRDITQQLLHAVAYVHSKGIIHTDIKAENILLVGGGATGITIKVVDFGSALYSHAWHPPLVGTMHYRGPEAVLQAGWSFPLDVWALGCLCVELYTGQHLFELAHDDVHLYMMERLLGPIPADMLRKGYSNLNQYNRSLLQTDSRGGVRIAPCRMEGFQMVANMRRLKDIVRDANFLNLVRSMLEYDPNKRVSASKAIEHPFFEVVDDGTENVEPAPEHAAPRQPTQSVDKEQQARVLEQARAIEQQQLKEAQALAKARSKSVADPFGVQNQATRAPNANPAAALAPPPAEPRSAVTEPKPTPAPPLPMKDPARQQARPERLSEAAPPQPQLPPPQEPEMKEAEAKREVPHHVRMPSVGDTQSSAQPTRVHPRSMSMGGADALSAMLQQRASLESVEANEEDKGVMSDYADGVMSDYPLVSAPSRVAQAEAAHKDLDALDKAPGGGGAGVRVVEPAMSDYAAGYKRPLVDSDKPPPVQGQGQGHGSNHTESEQSQSSTVPPATWSGRVSHDSDYGDSSEPGEGAGSGSMTPKESLGGGGWPTGSRGGEASVAPPPLVHGGGGSGGVGWPTKAPGAGLPATAQFLGELQSGARAE